MGDAVTSLAAHLLGSWELVSWAVLDAAGVRAPFGNDPTGTLIYAADGRMAAVVAAGDRPLLSQPTPRRAPCEEVRAAFASFFCYTGRWHVEGDDVVHAVEGALNPAMAGTVQRRRIVLDGAVLELVADEPLEPGVRRHRLRWQRPA
jgi:hypothetical protein